ncbi:tripartite tricarboxylate transporter substrate binding protein [Ramlibacter sp.]|uniref:Bug family tripartite tricarboxylate transporter substrate binding protein n=1 Tax=Ramlibacter sp. TaxID=1917967 RepID=UPI002C89A04C|nr:tripartite tricarboxylate transporter substrate binding protein [Ramlibacter sp.]HWI84226.1 tripartite tricarboxylate transporter substrate binding protein [Ramlibacter sp.]
MRQSFSFLSCRSRWLAVMTVALAAVAPAAAQDYPAKSIQFVVPYPPGGASDVVARTIGQKLSEAWKQPVVIENRPGANGIIAMSHVAKSAPDGYTLLMGNVGPNAINPSIYKLPFDAAKDFQPVSLTNLVPLMLVVNANAGINSVEELIAKAKAAPGRFSYGTGGTGTAGHFAMELFMMNAGIRMERISYKGDGLALQDMIGGHIHAMFTTGPSSLAHVQSGRLKALAVGTKNRLPHLPNVPTVAELGMPGFEAVSWGGVLVPANTPKPVVHKLNAEINRILKMPEVREALSKTGSETVGNSPEEFESYIAFETGKWAKVAKIANIKGE